MPDYATCKYLVITLYDNDYTGYGRELGNLIHNCLRIAVCDDWTKIDDTYIESRLSYISHLWHSIHQLTFGTIQEYDPFAWCITFRIVEYSEIPEWNNHQDVYIPLMDKGDSFVV